MTRTTCSACGSTDLELFLDLGTSPIADAYTATPDEPAPRHPLRVAVCGKCRLVQLLDVVEDLFGTGYSFYSSASAPLSAYHAAYAKDVLARYPDLAAFGVLEIGCNDGDFLRHFTHLPHLGYDPAWGPAAVARQRGCNVVNQPFGLSEAKLNHTECTRPGIVVANHVLAHVEDVSDVLAGAAAVMRHDGVVFIEVQYLPDLLVNNAFDLIYHEHRNFFSLTSLSTAAARWGLHPVDAVLTDRQGGSLRVTFRRAPLPGNLRGLPEAERWLDSWGAYEGMQGRVERIRTRLQDLIATQHPPVAAYGAPAKLTTLLSFCELDVRHISWCVDTTRAKQGRWLPGTGIPIMSPNMAEKPSAYLLAAHNYARHIITNNPGNRWIVPIPAPVVL